jgi:hypothetical protein
MKLTIKNIERLNGLGDYDSAYIVRHLVTDQLYEIIMCYEGFNWNVALYRNIHPAYNKYRMSVQMAGMSEFESTAIDKDELNSAGITLSIIESLMDKILKKIKA